MKIKIPPSFRRMARRMRQNPAKLARKSLRDLAACHRKRK